MSLSKLSAFFQQGFVLARSYKLNFAAKYIATFVTVIFYFFLARLFERAGVSVAPGTDYFSFLLVGGSFVRYLEIGMRTLPDTLREEMLTGTLEPLLVTATPTSLALLGPSLFILGEGTLLVSVQLALGGLLGADFSRANWLAATVAALLTVGCLFCWGLVSMAITLRFKRQDPVNWIVAVISNVFSGVFFPVTLLPPAMQLVAYALPFTYGLQALRGALLNGRTVLDLVPELVALSLFTAALLPLALYAIRSSTRYVRQTGALGHY